MEDGGWRMEDGGWRMEDGGWRMEDGGWRMEDGGWRRGWRIERTGGERDVRLPGGQGGPYVKLEPARITGTGPGSCWRCRVPTSRESWESAVPTRPRYHPASFPACWASTAGRCRIANLCHLSR